MYLKIYTKIIIVFGLLPSLEAQKHYDYNWAFGYGRSVPNDTNFFGGAIMSFNDKLIHFYPQARTFDLRFQTNSFSDNTGDFLYLSNGCSLRDKYANNLRGADTIGFGEVWAINCPLSNNDTQAGLFLPHDDSTVSYIYQVVDTIGVKLRYEFLLSAKIYIPNDSLIYKDKLILHDTLYHGLQAIPASDNKNWWIIHPQYNVNKIWTVLYSSTGILHKIENVIGYKNDSVAWSGGQGAFSPNGKHYALYSPFSGLHVYDFDRITGLLSNFRYYNIIYSHDIVGGCAFSPDSRFLYVCNPTEVLQIDLHETDSTKAIDTVGVFDNFFEPYPTTYLQMALGPDCRIYISTNGGNRYLHVIMYPNKKGKECQLINRGLKLPSRNSFAIPNIPHYRVDDPYPCDSTIAINLNVSIAGDEPGSFRNCNLMVYPIPTHDILYLHNVRQQTEAVHVSIIDMQGKVLKTISFKSLNEEQPINLSSFNSGMYTLLVMESDGRFWVEKIVKF